MNPVSFLQNVENALRKMTDQEFPRHAPSILQRELGTERFARFLRLYRAERGDYTKEREELLKGVTIDDLVEQFRSADRPGPEPKQ